jgi:hypothetical protein
MSMSRMELAGYLWGRLQAQFTEVGIVNADSSGNLKEPLDDTFVALGFSFSDAATATVEDADTQKALALVRYYGLTTVYDAALNRTDEQKSVGAPSVSLSQNKSQFVRQLENALFRAKENAEPFLPKGDTWIFGSISTDTIGAIPETV